MTPFKYLVVIITADNGKEFAYHKEVSQSLECGYFLQIPTVHGSDG
ncbi:MAG: hypothetical protein KAH18_06890 [Psychromonas sp.]|nr:hypothetical protein [Psychromonas sp.]